MDTKTTELKKWISILAITMLLISALPFTNILTTTAGSSSTPTVELDKDYYSTGATATITVNHPAANVSTYRKDSVEVNVTSWIKNYTDYVDGLIVTLVETEVSSGIFEGDLKLVSKLPGENEVVVRDTGFVWVNYSDVSDFARVDDTRPIVTNLNPPDGSIISDTTPKISAYVNDTVAFSLAWMTVDNTVYNSTTTPGYFSYQVLEKGALSEGRHDVVVTAQDQAGKINETSWWFKVDTTEPTCTITTNITLPAVKAGGIEFLFEFNEDMSDTPKVTIEHNATKYMTKDTSGWKGYPEDKRTFSANYTIEDAADFNGTVLLTASGAEDVGGMTMLPKNYTFYIDNVEPYRPENLTAKAEAGANVLDWDAATDHGGSGVAYYNIYRNDTTTPEDFVLIDTAMETSYRDVEGVPETEYVYRVNAVDAAGNEGDNSNVATATFMGAYMIELEKGWNLISLPLVPDNKTIEAVLGDVMVNVTVVWSYDAETGEWFSFKPGAPSTLTEMVDGKGYWVNMTASATLTVYGSVLPAPPAVPPAYEVVPGWNLIGYKETTSMNASEYLDGIVYRRLYTYYDGTYHIVEPDDLMVPGRGYWIAVTEAGTIYP